jgi:hypothetical protein
MKRLQTRGSARRGCDGRKESIVVKSLTGRQGGEPPTASADVIWLTNSHEIDSHDIALKAANVNGCALLFVGETPERAAGDAVVPTEIIGIACESAPAMTL